MISPKVSIIIPFFNPGESFKSCLNSLKIQTLKEIEIIFVDDGSTDDSVDILHDYIGNSSFKLIRQENQGAGIARNNAIERATGEYILFLDSDDWIEPDACEKLYNHAKRLDSDLVLFDVLWHVENNKTNGISYFTKDSSIDFNNFTFSCDFVKDKMMRGIYGVIWSKFYKTSYIKENNIKFPPQKIYNDIEFHFRTMMLTEKISYLPRIFYHYSYVDKPSLQKSFKGSEYELCWFDVIMGIRRFLNENQLFDEFKEDFLKYFIHYSQIKLDDIHIDFKQQLFIRLKYFFESLKLSFDDFENFPVKYIVFYFHIINSNDYLMFKEMQDNFDGSILDTGDFMLNENFIKDEEVISNDKKNLLNKEYAKLMENKSIQLNNILENNKQSHINEINSKNNKIKDLNSKIDTLKKELNNSKKKNNLKDKEIKKLSSKLNLLESEYDDLSLKFKNKSDEAYILDYDSNFYKNEYLGCEKRVYSLENNIKSLKNENVRLNQELNELKSKNKF